MLQQLLRKHVEEIKSDTRCPPLDPGTSESRALSDPGGAVSAVWLHNCCLLTWRSEDRAVACGPPLPASIISCCGQRAGLSQGPGCASLAVLPRSQGLAAYVSFWQH